jgi:hypothetical protein
MTQITTLFYIDLIIKYVYGLEHQTELHEVLCEKVKNIKGKFIISYEDNTIIHTRCIEGTNSL